MMMHQALADAARFEWRAASACHLSTRRFRLLSSVTCRTSTYSLTCHSASSAGSAPSSRNSVSAQPRRAPAFLMSFREAHMGFMEDTFHHAVCDADWKLHHIFRARGLLHNVLAVGNGVYWISVVDAERNVKWYVLSPASPHHQIEIPVLENPASEDFYAAYSKPETGGFTLLRISNEFNEFGNKKTYMDLYSSANKEWSMILEGVPWGVPNTRKTKTDEAQWKLETNSNADCARHWHTALSSRRILYSNGCLFWTSQDVLTGFKVRVLKVSDLTFSSLVMPGRFRFHDLPKQTAQLWSFSGCMDCIVALEEWSGNVWRLDKFYDEWTWHHVLKLDDDMFYGKPKRSPSGALRGSIPPWFARFHAWNGKEWMICQPPDMPVSSLSPSDYICVKDSKGRNLCSFTKPQVLNVLQPSCPDNVKIEGIWAIEY